MLRKFLCFSTVSKYMPVKCPLVNISLSSSIIITSCFTFPFHNIRGHGTQMELLNQQRALHNRDPKTQGLFVLDDLQSREFSSESTQWPLTLDKNHQKRKWVFGTFPAKKVSKQPPVPLEPCWIGMTNSNHYCYTILLTPLLAFRHFSSDSKAITPSSAPL